MGTTEGPMVQFDHQFTAPQLQQLAQWAPQLGALEEMGVEQPLQRATLLLQHNGDLKAAVKQLLAQKWENQPQQPTSHTTIVASVHNSRKRRASRLNDGLNV